MYQGTPARTMKVAMTRYRLLFNHPFGTAHGVRDGTDALFLHLQRGSYSGYGEATMPPYVAHGADMVLEVLRSLLVSDLDALDQAAWEAWSKRHAREWPAPARAAVHMALCDLWAKEQGISVRDLLGLAPSGVSHNMFTIGDCPEAERVVRLGQVPSDNALKIKVGSVYDEGVIEWFVTHTERMLFLDANQGWRDVDEAAQLVALVPRKRCLGIEQPFKHDRPDMHAALRARIEVPVIADESISTLEELEAYGDAFDGVNLKLMKCGGLDHARHMAERARAMDKLVMLGCMSESTLGCAAMLSLDGMADLVDLDGPWLLRNDPFEGMEMAGKRWMVQGGHGHGVTDRGLLEWTPFGA